MKVDAQGLAIGRALGNDVVIKNQAASQLHALVHVGARGPELLSFGRNGTRVNGETVEGGILLRDGDKIEVPGEELGVLVEGGFHGDDVVQWAIASPEGALFGLRRAFRVGGGRSDDLLVPAWPPGALLCTPVQGALVLRVIVAASVGGDSVPSGEMRLAKVGDEVEIEGVSVRVFGQTACTTRDTALTPEASLPTQALFTFLPSGALLKLKFEHGEASVRLSEVRARLVATLLGAGTGVLPGEWVVDEVVIPHVWPRQESKTRVDVNILVHRLRRDLLKMGVNPFAVIERQERATRFLLASGGTAKIE